MKKPLSLLLTAILLLIMWGCNKQHAPLQESFSKTNDLDHALELYNEFLMGERTAKPKKGDYEISINDIFFGNEWNEWNKYAMFDMNGDGIPELHIRSVSFYEIFTYKEEALISWSGFMSRSAPLNNGAVLTVRHGGANSTTTYFYQEFDFNGNERMRVDFDSAESNEGIPVYFFENTEVSKKEWDALTEKYLSIGSDKIEWISADTRR